MKKRILIVLGTRPEAIKLAPVFFALRAHPAYEVKLLSSGQHREMLTSALSAFNLTPDFDLDLMRDAQPQAELVSAMLPRVASVLQELAPSCVIVQGDTCSTFVGALAGYLTKIPVAHVEAGLRTGDKYAPYPEEVYRRLVADLADIHFAPTSTARAHLLGEGIAANRIHITGNTAIDALHLVLARDPQQTLLAKNTRLMKMFERRFVLITCHRRESFGPDMEAIMAAICALAERHPTVNFLFPVHLNPNVGAIVHRVLGAQPNVLLTPPLDYASFAHVLKACHFVMTDSGGIQEEAAELGKPVLVLRRTTEREEGVNAGTAILVGVDTATIEPAADLLLTDDAAYRRSAVATHVYGDGHAARAIVNILDVELSRAI